MHSNKIERGDTIKNIVEHKDLLEQFMEMIAQHFGSRCEVALHDLTGDYDTSIIAIKNGHVSGRKVGGSGSNLGLEILRGADKENESNKYRYSTKTQDGKILNSSSMYFKDDDGKTIASLCINYDISDLILAEHTIHSLTTNYKQTEVEEVLVQDTHELFQYLISGAQSYVGKPVSLMDRDDKLNFIEYLDKRGAFLIKKAGERVCEYLDVSKYFLYSVLNESREKQQDS